MNISFPIRNLTNAWNKTRKTTDVAWILLSSLTFIVVLAIILWMEKSIDFVSFIVTQRRLNAIFFRILQFSLRHFEYWIFSKEKRASSMMRSIILVWNIVTMQRNQKSNVILNTFHMQINISFQHLENLETTMKIMSHWIKLIRCAFRLCEMLMHMCSHTQSTKFNAKVKRRDEKRKKWRKAIVRSLRQWKSWRTMRMTQCVRVLRTLAQYIINLVCNDSMTTAAQTLCRRCNQKREDNKNWLKINKTKSRRNKMDNNHKKILMEIVSSCRCWRMQQSFSCVEHFGRITVSIFSVWFSFRLIYEE